MARSQLLIIGSVERHVDVNSAKRFPKSSDMSVWLLPSNKKNLFSFSLFFPAIEKKLSEKWLWSSKSLKPTS